MGIPYNSMLEAVLDEMKALLMNFYFYQRRINRLTSNPPEDPEDFAEEVCYIESMEREIIMGLCRLDEDGSDTYSFRRYRKELAAQSIDQARQKAMNTALSDYRSKINPIKTKCRNYYIGHLSTKHNGSFTTPEKLQDFVESAVSVMDILTATKQSYILDGIGVQKIDLRDKLKI